MNPQISLKGTSDSNLFLHSALVMSLRDTAKLHLSYIIGNCQPTSLWFDPWDAGAPICSSKNNPIIS